MLAVSATGDTLKQAIDKAYLEGEKIHFENKYFRHDIGARALKAGK